MAQQLPPVPKTLADFMASQMFVASEDLPGFLICTRCACPVLAGGEERHTASMHGFRGL